MKKLQITIILIFLLFLGGMSVGTLVAPKREFSPNENRYLSGTPTFSWEDVKNGKFQDGLESYLNDQILGRDLWITMKTAVEKTAGDTDIGGAYVGRNGYDFEKITPEDIDEKLVKRNIDSVQNFFEDVSSNTTLDKEHLSFLLVPTSGLVMERYLPKHARLFDQNRYIDQTREALEGYQFVDVRSELLAHNEEYLYYKTDHHWTSDGAKLAAEQWRQVMGLTTDTQNTQKTIVTSSFKGSLYSKILDADSAKDEIWIYGLKDPVAEMNRHEVVADGKRINVYDESKLTEKDQYAFFFGGNYGETQIEGKAGNGRSLLVIKDSFANTFVPQVIDEFEHIYMIDLRYYNEDVQQYLTEHEITDVLVLYNISNFVTDRNLFKLTARK